MDFPVSFQWWAALIFLHVNSGSKLSICSSYQLLCAGCILVHISSFCFPSYLIPGLELLENWYLGFGCLSKVEKWTLDGNPSIFWLHRASLIYIILLGSGDMWIDSPCWIIFTLISRNCLILCSALFLHCLFIWSNAFDIYSNICMEGSCKDLPRGM